MKTINIQKCTPCPHCGRNKLIVDTSQPTKIIRNMVIRFYTCILCDIKVSIGLKRS